ncbi:MAG: hypothetical protein H7A45_01585 [Verrucomicrobiales bacterium]|nr:hypothetical protein [Verrucomicrobiales bacterium]
MYATGSSTAGKRAARLLTLIGSLAMILGAIDPLEGSLLVLPGSGLVALGAVLGGAGRRDIAYRVGVFVTITTGVGALWGLSSLGGLGGNTGRSLWWGVLILPYLVGWSMGIWGPRSPRWLLITGIGVGVWYLALLALIQTRSGGPPQPVSNLAGLALGAIGLLTIAGCVTRLCAGAPARPVG